MTEAGFWADVAKWVEASLGLCFAPSQRGDLERGFAAAAQRLGLPSAADCAARLMRLPAGARERDIAIECLAIGETYLFRDPALFETLATQVLQPLIAARRHGSRRLRLWSVGCSSGEEAYTLAMLVTSLLPDWRAWDLRVLGTDMNLAALRKARAAVYGRWSLRGGVPAAVRSLLIERPDGSAQVDPELARRVRFAPLNLATGAYPSAADATTGMDLVICRNVLLYFDRARANSVLARLGEALDEDGWLVTGAVESPVGGLPQLVRANVPGLLAWRRRAIALTSGAEPAPAPAATRALPRRARSAVPVVTRTPEPDAAAAAPTAAELAQQARACADAGELERAEHLCQAAIARDKLAPQWCYLLATILAEQARPDEAVAALRRTLFLDPGHLLARFMLGRLARDRGDEDASKRHFERALARLGARRPDEVLAGADGLTAGELAGLIRRCASEAAG